MKLWRDSRRTVSMSVLALMLAGLVLVVANALFPSRVRAAQPPPPSPPTLTVAQLGGDSHCKIGTYPTVNPGTHAYPYSETYTAGTTVELTATVECPCDRYFDHWTCSNSTVQDDLNHRDEFTMPSSSITVTAVYKTIYIAEGCHMLGAATGGSYGGYVKLIYDNAAGFKVKESVTWGPFETSPYCDCTSHGALHVQDTWQELVRCDELGDPSPTGTCGYVEDAILNGNGPPAILRQVLIANGKSLPCGSTTNQISYVTNQCYTWEFPHTQRIEVSETSSSPPSGTVRTSSSDCMFVEAGWQT